MHDWMFEPGGELLTLPEPQPYAPEDSSWFAATPGGEDDWLVSLPTPSSLPDIEVPPPPRPTPGQFYNPGDYGGWDGHDTSEPWVPEYPPPPPDPYDACEDRRADTIAEQINNIIRSKPDSDRVEYGALIWRDDSGQLHYTEVTPGDNGQWVPPAPPAGGVFHSWSQVVGYVHSHPTQVYQGNEWVNVRPESHFDRPSSGDWRTADFFIAQGASLENFTVYVSYNGQIKEFDSRMNTNQSRSSAPMAGHGIESGTYQPGASCR